MNENVNPGYHPHAKEEIGKYFSLSEIQIADKWANEWYVTNAGSISIGLKSEYKYLLIKATQSYEEIINLSREVIVVFSSYNVFEPRTLDAFEEICKRFQSNRIERICYVLISADNNIENHLAECLSNQESQVIVPFCYNEFIKPELNFIINRFRKCFYERDLFDISTPLKNDYYFFGRSNISIEVIQKHKHGQNYGLFGLRKTGKTSIIFDIMRKVASEDICGVFIDCQSTAISQRRWNQALYYIINSIYEELKIKLSVTEDDFNEADAAILFEKYIKQAKETSKKTILILFDEIENITFNKSAVEHWCNGLDFVYFWQSIRSVYQKLDSVFTFCILGTNPRCIEVPTIHEKDNPIFNIFKPSYINGFDYSQTKEMVRKLGRIMGVKFDETIYAKLTEDYGGHPFLIRQVCSAIAKNYSSRPINIDRLKYNTVKKEFNLSNDYFKQLLEVLIQFYPDEYEMLKILATEDLESFNYFVNTDYSMVKHLKGYGIIKETDDEYDFQIDAIKEYILRQENKVSLYEPKEEKWKKVVALRGNLETELRKMVKTILKISFSSEYAAKEYVIKKIHDSDKKYFSLAYSDLFDSRKSTIYLKDLTVLINGKWEFFKEYWANQEMFIQSMNIINKEGRFDCHATVPTKEEMDIIMSAVTLVKRGIDKFKSDIE